MGKENDPNLNGNINQRYNLKNASHYQITLSLWSLEKCCLRGIFYKEFSHSHAQCNMKSPKIHKKIGISWLPKCGLQIMLQIKVLSKFCDLEVMSLTIEAIIHSLVPLMT
jgi:hypothetical protein